MVLDIVMTSENTEWLFCNTTVAREIVIVFDKKEHSGPLPRSLSPGTTSWKPPSSTLMLMSSGEF